MRLELPSPNATFDLEMDDGAVIHFRRYGDPAGVRLVISHGNGFAIDGYLPFWGLLLDRFDLVLFDMRNHGRNRPTGADGHHYAQMARDLESVFHGVNDRLGEKEAVGVFHSMSARAAMKQAVEIGWRWRALVLYDPPNVPPPDHPLYEKMEVFERRLMDFAMTRPNRFAAPEELAEQYASNRGHSRWVPGAHELMARAVLRQEEAGGDWELTCRRELEASIYLAAMTLDLWPPYEAYGGPVKLVGADPEMKGVPPTAHVNRALHLEHGYAYEAIPETGHLLQIERPVECAKALTSFLEECDITV
ncbi:MAG: alpha/beta hydrolase [Alphaproteobacteria bacterium]|jgi:pimeloyl-ACP methyl ester carboxylesterase|nr:alpha/beta hydrolase [Alphaproteobacteria bacterium]